MPPGERRQWSQIAGSATVSQTRARKLEPRDSQGNARPSPSDAGSAQTQRLAAAGRGTSRTAPAAPTAPAAQPAPAQKQQQAVGEKRALVGAANLSTFDEGVVRTIIEEAAEHAGCTTRELLTSLRESVLWYRRIALAACRAHTASSGGAIASALSIDRSGFVRNAKVGKKIAESDPDGARVLASLDAAVLAYRHHVQQRMSASSGRATDAATPSASDVIKQTARHHNVTVDRLLRDDKKQASKHARYLAMFVCRHALGMAPEQIAEAFGRTSATVHEAVRHVADRSITNPAWADSATAIIEACRQQQRTA